jgi:ribosomal-protein-serine acetyltransferase
MTRAPERLVRGALVLRRWRRTDAMALSTAVRESLDHLRPWMPWAAAEPLPIEERHALLARWERAWDVGDELSYGMFVSRRVVGACSLMRRIGPGGMEIGYWVHARHVRKGYASTAAAALTDVAFGLPDVTRVEIRHDLANLASGRVPPKLGYQLIGDEPDEVSAPGEVGMSRIWRMTAAAWPHHRPPDGVARRLDH